MDGASKQQWIQLAANHIGAGRLAEGEKLCRQVLAQEPDHAAAHHLLGAIASRVGQHDQAIALVSRATQLAPGAESYSHLGEILTAAGRHPDALNAYQQSLRLKPNVASVWNNLGVELRALGQLQPACDAYRRATQLDPSIAQTWLNLGVGLQDLRDFVGAIAALQRAVQLDPNNVETLNALGTCLSVTGRLDESIAVLGRAVQIKPDFLPALVNLGNSYRTKKAYDQAIEVYRRGIQVAPNDATALYNLGSALHDAGRAEESMAAHLAAIRNDSSLADGHYAVAMLFSEANRTDEAAAKYLDAIAARPTFAMAHNDLGNIYKDQGRLDEALARYHRAAELDPSHVGIASNLLYVAHFHSDYDPARLYAMHRTWNERHARPFQKLIRPFTNSREPGRRLKIGFVSPDFTFAPVGRFIEPLFREYDRSQLQFICYSDVRKPVAMTNRLQKFVDGWKDNLGLSDDQVAEQIRRDQIDILIDLTMHMTDHRLAVFARKPAPIQVSYLAYCSTTGLETIDYRLTDRWLEPPGLGDQFYSEKSAYLHSYWCYDCGVQMPDVAPLPALASGRITYGCLNNFCKASSQALHTWAELLRRSPGARMLLHSKPGSHRQRLIDLFATHEAADRLEFVAHVSLDEYFKLYNQIDIALDPFPWPGGTTTCDALYMGVPVVSLAGKTAVSRAGVSILSTIGRSEWISDSPDRYIEIARNLAADLPALQKIRTTLRQQMCVSPLMDAKGFAQDFAAVLRKMWISWAEKR